MKNLYKHLLNINKAQTMVDITNIIEEDIRSSKGKGTSYVQGNSH